jgi:hypothetical protein
MSGNWGIFEGENGLAMNAALRVVKNVQLNGGVAWGLGENIAGGRVGWRASRSFKQEGKVARHRSPLMRSLHNPYNGACDSQSPQ